ncbi:hypothetical protein [Streptomyces xinghaiensis]|uniref:hypothetical protein n=1 Tax=Streptomyces xinghaiensis TaxID=1038928 RepID=UPI0012FF7591|nr:hypothetical protein [Streptomyces xinghaiensis]MZE79720.1 hypothetical protein [Streptomyces sp. SID5475]
MSANTVTLLVGATTALVALAGYLLTQATARRDRETHFYARALEAIKEFEEMPYRISRRPSSDGATRSAVGGQLSDTYVEVEFYRAWLRIHSPLAGEAYSILLTRCHRELREHIRKAWENPALETDSEAQLNGEFDIDNSVEWELFILVAGRELSLREPLRRIGTRQAIRKYRTQYPDR